MSPGENSTGVDPGGTVPAGTNPCGTGPLAGTGPQQGFSAGLPIALGYLPIAVTFGILARQAGLSSLEAAGMSVFVFAGASQFIALKLLASGISILQIVLTTFIINFRHFLLSASLSQRLRSRRRHALLLAFGITDETFVVASMREPLNEPVLMGLILTAYLAWVGGTLAGSLLAGLIPLTLVKGMSTALYALFIALLVPAVRGKPLAGLTALLSALAGWALSRLFPGLSSGWIIVIATLAASTTGIFSPDQEKTA